MEITCFLGFLMVFLGIPVAFSYKATTKLRTAVKHQVTQDFSGLVALANGQNHAHILTWDMVT
jgi:uncharacterized membrane protein